MKLSFRKDIQGLRAIAFLTVFLFHLNPTFLSGGFIGVDIFFVISGFLMTSIIINQKEKSQFNFIDFYKKRIFRIIPPLYFMTVVVILCCLYLILPNDVLTIRTSAVNALVFTANLFFNNQGDYFGANLAENPFLHTWSLAIEVQFYLLIPVILYFIPNRFLKKTLIVFSILILTFTTYLQSQEVNLYYSTVARIPEFFMGSLAFFYSGKRSIAFKNSASVVGILVIISASIFYSKLTVFPGISAIIVCLATLCLLCTEGSIVNKWISNSFFVHIGKLSYSLYLWHWPIMALIRYNNDSAPFEMFDYWLIIGLTYFSSFISYHLIERKLASVFFKLKIVYSFLILSVTCSLIYFSYFFFQIKRDSFYDMYAQPNFGLISHNSPNVQRLGLQNNDSTNILLIGDSHALTCKLMYDIIAKRNGFSLNTVSADAYPPLEILKFIDKDDVNFRSKFYQNSLSYAASLPNILSKYNVIILQMGNYEGHKSIIPKKIIENLRDDQFLILVHSYPTIDRSPIRINKGYLKTSNYDFKIIETELPTHLKEIIQRNDNVFLLNLNQSKTIQQSIYHSDTSLYYDAGHINDLGSTKLALEFEDDFIKLWHKINQKQ